MSHFLNLFIRILLCIGYYLIGLFILTYGYFDPLVTTLLLAALVYFGYATWSDHINTVVSGWAARLRQHRQARKARKAARKAAKAPAAQESTQG